MFALIYEFNVNANQVAQFRKWWRQLTLLTKSKSASLGSRLHKVTDQIYMGYSLWPSREAWETSNLDLPEVAILREQLVSTCSDIQIIYQADIVDDLLGNSDPQNYH